MEILGKIGRYEIQDAIGSGLQGTVYRALDPELDRQVAIKLLRADDPSRPPDADDGASALEARISSKLRHPNIIPIYDFGRHQDSQYLVFEYVEGQTLRQVLGSHGNLSIEELMPYAIAIADAIAYAHSQGVVHLDLSPRNILVDKELNPRIMDFGLSQFSHDFVNFGDQVKGSPMYMSPEHFSEDKLGPYTDVYALGASFYQLAAGVPIFHAMTFVDIVEKIKNEAVDMSRLPDGPATPAFAAILQACLEKNFRKRLQDGEALRDALKRLVSRYPLAGLQSTETHSTVQFLLRRMQRKEDFPAISRILSDINRLTDENSGTSAEKLANVILRDYGLTNKLLKLVNSAFFGNAGSEVSSVSRAIVVLGVEQVRSTANSLAYFGQMQGDTSDEALRDAMIQSFLSGLIARHLVQRIEAGDPEEAFICGLFRNLGENLTIYYFPEDHTEIQEMIEATGSDRNAASQRVLGVSYADLGVEVAGIWGLPGAIVNAIRGHEGEVASEPLTPDEATRDCAVFANALCEIAAASDAASRTANLEALLEPYRTSLMLTADYVIRLLAAGLKKLSENASALEFEPKRSRFCTTVSAWLAELESESSAYSSEPEAAVSKSAQN